MPRSPESAPAAAPTDPAAEIAHQHLAAQIAGVDVGRFGPPAHHHVVLRGRRFHYLDWGGPASPPLVFLHGGAQTARTWDLVCLALRHEYHCLALDQRGHGDSEWSYELDYSVAAFAGDVEAFLDHLNLGRVVLVGMSLGCGAAVAYATRHSGRLAGLVAIDAGPGVEPGAGRPIAEFVEGHRTLPSVDAYVEAALRFNPRRDSRLLRHSLLHNLRQLPDGTWTWKGDRRQAVDLAALVRELEEVWARLEAIRCPTLVVRGGESQMFSAAMAADFAARLPHGRWVEVEQAGHTVQGDNPAGLVRELRAFLLQVHDPTIAQT